jgi:hypothetical protein
MSSDEDIEGLVEALRDDGPSDHDAVRIQARLAALGVIAGASLAKGTAAASMPAGKIAAGVGASTRWASLSLLPKMGVVAAVSATALAGSVGAVHLVHHPVVSHTAEARPAAPVAKAPARVALRAEPTSRPADNAVPPMDVAPRSVALTRTARSVAVNAVAPIVADVPVATDVGGTARYAEAPGDVTAPPLVTSLAAETALIDAAFAALRAGDNTTAAGFVTEHARRFPNGLLSRERERARQRLADIAAAR